MSHGKDHGIVDVKFGVGSESVFVKGVLNSAIYSRWLKMKTAKSSAWTRLCAEVVCAL